MASERNDPTACPDVDELLPNGSASVDFPPSDDRAAHVRSCARCSALLGARVAQAAELRALPRLAAPAGGPAADFDSIVRAADGSLERELATAEARWRPEFAALARLRAPDDLEAPVAVRPLLFVRMRPAAAVLAAAVLVIAALLAEREGRRDGERVDSLALQAERLTRCASPVALAVVERTPSGAESTLLAERAAGGLRLPLAGGGP